MDEQKLQNNGADYRSKRQKAGICRKYLAIALNAIGRSDAVLEWEEGDPAEWLGEIPEYSEIRIDLPPGDILGGVIFEWGAPENICAQAVRWTYYSGGRDEPPSWDADAVGEPTGWCSAIYEVCAMIALDFIDAAMVAESERGMEEDPHA